MKYKNELGRLKNLIKDGRALAKNCESFGGRGGVLGIEGECSKWFTQTINFLSKIFGENSKQVRLFVNYFGSYHKKSLLTEEYRGKILFVKEDMERAIGHLEGVHSSLEKGEIKRINPINRFLINLWVEFKSLLGVFIKLIRP